MKHYRIIVYYDGHKDEMIANASSKKEAFNVIVNIYKEKIESKEVAIIVKDLSYEEKKIYQVKD